MTSLEKLKEILYKIDLQSLSDQELADLQQMLIMEKANVDWVVKCRKHFSLHVGSEKNKANC